MNKRNNDYMSAEKSLTFSRDSLDTSNYQPQLQFAHFHF